MHIKQNRVSQVIADGKNKLVCEHENGFGSIPFGLSLRSHHFIKKTKFNIPVFLIVHLLSQPNSLHIQVIKRTVSMMKQIRICKMVLCDRLHICMIKCLAKPSHDEALTWLRKAQSWWLSNSKLITTMQYSPFIPMQFSTGHLHLHSRSHICPQPICQYYKSNDTITVILRNYLFCKGNPWTLWRSHNDTG